MEFVRGDVPEQNVDSVCRLQEANLTILVASDQGDDYYLGLLSLEVVPGVILSASVMHFCVGANSIVGSYTVATLNISDRLFFIATNPPPSAEVS